MAIEREIIALCGGREKGYSIFIICVQYYEWTSWVVCSTVASDTSESLTWSDPSSASLLDLSSTRTLLRYSKSCTLWRFWQFCHTSHLQTWKAIAKCLSRTKSLTFAYSNNCVCLFTHWSQWCAVLSYFISHYNTKWDI